MVGKNHLNSLCNSENYWAQRCKWSLTPLRSTQFNLITLSSIKERSINLAEIWHIISCCHVAYTLFAYAFTCQIMWARMADRPWTHCPRSLLPGTLIGIQYSGTRSAGGSIDQPLETCGGVFPRHHETFLVASFRAGEVTPKWNFHDILDAMPVHIMTPKKEKKWYSCHLFWCIGGLFIGKEKAQRRKMESVSDVEPSDDEEVQPRGTYCLLTYLHANNKCRELVYRFWGHQLVQCIHFFAYTPRYWLAFNRHSVATHFVFKCSMAS